MNTTWVTAAALRALAERTIVEGGMFTAEQLGEWTQEQLDLVAPGFRESALCARFFQGPARGVRPTPGIGGGRHRGGADECGVQVGHQRPDRRHRRGHLLGPVRTGRGGEEVHRPRPAVDRVAQILVDRRHHGLRAIRLPPGDHAQWCWHTGESGLAQHRDPACRRMGAGLQMGCPLHHRGIAHDHRLVDLVDGDGPFPGGRGYRPGLQCEGPTVGARRGLAQTPQERVGGTVTRAGAAPNTVAAQDFRNRAGADREPEPGGDVQDVSHPRPGDRPVR